MAYSIADYMDLDLNLGQAEEDDLPGRETTSQLINRLQRADCIEPVKIHVSRNANVRPALVEQAQLVDVSKYFARCFDMSNAFAKFHNVKQADRSFSFADCTSDTIKMFLYWLEHGIVPRIDDFDLPQSATDYQLLLARAVAFAEDKQVTQMHNDCMTALLENLEDVELEQDTLHKILRFSHAQGMLRLLVLEETLFRDQEGRNLLDGIDTKWLCGFEGDLARAKERFNKRTSRSNRQERKRAAAEEYFVR